MKYRRRRARPMRFPKPCNREKPLRFRVAVVDRRVGFLPHYAVADNRTDAERFAREALEVGMLSVAVVWLGRRGEVTLLRTGPYVDPECRVGRFTRVRPPRWRNPAPPSLWEDRRATEEERRAYVAGPPVRVPDATEWFCAGEHRWAYRLDGDFAVREDMLHVARAIPRREVALAADWRAMSPDGVAFVAGWVAAPGRPLMPGTIFLPCLWPLLEYGTLRRAGPDPLDPVQVICGGEVVALVVPMSLPWHGPHVAIRNGRPVVLSGLRRARGA